MKTLKKIKLVNWHIFVNETIEFAGNILVSGENGSGKSTMLDALQYILIGGRSGVKFNIAATDAAKRTLEGYVRGKIGAENREFLRSGDVFTHVAIEIFDHETQQSDVMGVIIEIGKMGHIKERFYHLENQEIHDAMFVEGKNPRDYRSMKTYFKTIDVDFEPFDTTKKYREALSRVLGLDAKKYAKILPKALAFKALNLQDFIFEFLLDDEPIDISALKNNVNELKKVEGQIRLDREKLTKLDKIVELGSKLSNDASQIEINELIEKVIKVEDCQETLIKAETEIEKLDNELDRLKQNQESTEHLINENDRVLLELESALMANDTGKTLKTLTDALETKKMQYDTASEINNYTKENLEREIVMLTQVNESQNNANIVALLKYYQTKKDYNVLELTNLLETVNKEINQLMTQLQVDYTHLNKERQTVSITLQQVNARLHHLQRNVKTYPQNVENLMSTLNTELSKIYQKEVNVRPVCELMEVNDENWRNALEGYLNAQKFDIVVDPSYFGDALEIYEKCAKTMGLYGVGIVNTNQITRYNTHQENSLASKLTCGSQYAQYYVNMLVGNVICVDDVQDLKKHSRSVSKSCMTYGNYTARSLNPRIYEVPYIGQKATAHQVKLEEKSLVELNNRLNELSDQIENNQVLSRLLAPSRIGHILAQNNLRYFDVIKHARSEIIELENRIDNLVKDKSLLALEGQLDEHKTKKIQLRETANAIIGNIANARRLKADNLTKIDESNERLKDLLAEQKELSQNNPTKLNAAFAQLNALKRRFDSNYAKIINDLHQSSIAIRTQNAKAENEVVNQMRVYIATYYFGAAPDISELIHFEKEANVIRNNDLVKYEQEAIDLRLAAETSFKEEFIYKLRASIEASLLQINELNAGLNGVWFGRDSYQFITKPAEDPLFKQYYNMIMSNDLLGGNDLFTENLSRKNEVILQELFDKIASSDPESDKMALLYLDYRNYLSYDIEITGEMGTISHFSKVANEKSGGETQAPFYIAMASSFQQLLSKNKKVSSACLVMLDEAFNKMDATKVDAIMKFYNALSIQVLVSVPPTKAQELRKFMDTSVALVNQKDRAIVNVIIKE